MDNQIISSSDLSNLEKRERTTLINGLSGFRSANLIASLSKTGNQNLAIFNSVMHIGADPALMGFIMRPEVVERQTLENIRYHKKFTINQVTQSIHKQAHLTSAKYDNATSEFEACNLTPSLITNFPIPFVAESPIKIALSLKEEVQIKSNNTILIIGQIEFICLENGILEQSGHINFDKIEGTAINGLDTYYVCKKIGSYKYAKPGMHIEEL